MSSPNVENIDPSSGQFVDPLFAIFIAAAVSETIIPWTNGTTAWTTVSFFEICVVCIGFINILLSWFGYHKSVIKKPIKGSLRFIVTVVLLPLYMLTIAMYDGSFLKIIVIYSIIFLLWSCWEYLRNIEYRITSSIFKIIFRFYNVVMFATLIFLVVINYVPAVHLNTWFVNNANEIALISLMVSIFSLRISKSAGEDHSPLAKIKAEILNLFFGNRE